MPDEQDLVLRLLLKIDDSELQALRDKVKANPVQIPATVAPAAGGMPGGVDHLGRPLVGGVGRPPSFPGSGGFSPSGAMLPPTGGWPSTGGYQTYAQVTGIQYPNGPPVARGSLGPGYGGYLSPAQPGGANWGFVGGAAGFGAPGGPSGWNAGTLAGSSTQPSGWNAGALSAAGSAQLLRNEMSGLNIQRYETDFKKLAQSMTQVHTGLMSLTAGVILFNKSMEEGSGFDNWYTRAVAVSALASGGGYLARGAGGALRQGAMAGANVLGAAATGLSAAALRNDAGVLDPTGAIVTYAGVSGASRFGARAAAGGSGFLGGVGTMSGASLAGAAAGLGAYALAVGATADYYMSPEGGSYLDYMANAGRSGGNVYERSAQLDAQLGAAVGGRASREQFYGNQRFMNRQGLAAGSSAFRYAGGTNELDYMSGLYGEQMDFATSRGRFGEAQSRFGDMERMLGERQSGLGLHIADLNQQYAGLGARQSVMRDQRRVAMGDDRPQEAAQISQQIAAYDQKRADIARQIAAAENDQVQAKGRLLQLSSQLTRAEISRADAARDSMGHTRGHSWQRGQRVYDRAMADGSLDEREARRLERMGYGDSSAVQGFWRGENQRREDEAIAGGRRGLLPEGARSSNEMGALEKTLATIQAQREAFAATFNQAAQQEIRILEQLASGQNELISRFNRLEARLPAAVNQR